MGSILFNLFSILKKFVTFIKIVKYVLFKVRLDSFQKRKLNNKKKLTFIVEVVKIELKKKSRNRRG